MNLSTADKLLQDLLKQQQKNRDEKSQPYGGNTKSWISQKRHNLQKKIEKSWKSISKTTQNIRSVFADTDVASLIAAFFAVGILLMSLFAPWYVFLISCVIFMLPLYVAIEIRAAITHIVHQKNCDLDWGDTAVFEDSYGHKTTDDILEKAKYMALVRAAGVKHPHLLDLSQRLLDEVDSTPPYHAHQIAKLLQKEFKIDGWSVVETTPSMLVEVQTAAHGVRKPEEKKIMRI